MELGPPDLWRTCKKADTRTFLGRSFRPCSSRNTSTSSKRTTQPQSLPKCSTDSRLLDILRLGSDIAACVYGSWQAYVVSLRCTPGIAIPVHDVSSRMGHMSRQHQFL